MKNKGRRCYRSAFRLDAAARVLTTGDGIVAATPAACLPVKLNDVCERMSGEQGICNSAR